MQCTATVLQDLFKFGAAIAVAVANQGKFSPNMMGDYFWSLLREDDSGENKSKSKCQEAFLK